MQRICAGNVMLQQENFEDYVMLPEKTSVKDFVNFCCAELEIDWCGRERGC